MNSSQIAHREELKRQCKNFGHLMTDPLKQDGKTFVRCRRCEIEEDR